MLLCTMFGIGAVTANAADDYYTDTNTGVQAMVYCKGGTGLTGWWPTVLILPPYSTVTGDTTTMYQPITFTLPDTNPDNGQTISGYEFWPKAQYFPGTTQQPSFTLRPGQHTMICALSGNVFIDGQGSMGIGGINISPDGSPYITGVTYSTPAKDDPPTLTVPSETRLTVGDWFDPMQGVTATDAKDGNLTSFVTYSPATVDTSKPGTTVVTYTVTDSGGNTVTARQTVIVEQAAATEHTLTFDLQGGTMTDPTSQTIPTGSTPTKPTDPTKQGSRFDGWYLVNGTQYDFAQPLTEDLTIFAKWTEQATTIACAPQTGDPATSIIQQASMLAGGLLIGAASCIGILKRKHTERSKI